MVREATILRSRSTPTAKKQLPLTIKRRHYDSFPEKIPQQNFGAMA
jgi:hypothetical protein